jgi:hypothetical protein
MKNSVCSERIFIGMALMLILFVSTARAEMASVYGGRDGSCGSRTANGERVNCSNDSGSSPIAIWHAGSRLSQQMRHSSH